MQVTMIKKRLSDGHDCRKCVQVEALLKDRQLWQKIHRVVWAVEDDPSSEGTRLAQQHGARHTPFFLVGDGQRERMIENALELIRILEKPVSVAEAMTLNDFDLASLDEMDTLGVVQAALATYGKSCPIAFSGAEDVVLIDMAARTGLEFSAFCLDTGRLHAETYDLIERVRTRYAIEIAVISPDAAAVEQLVTAKGLFSFYRDGHAECCAIRKVAPLRRMLIGKRAWMTGQRRDQSPDTRAAVPIAHHDATFRGTDERPMLKLNPLAAWTSQDVWTYILEHDVPYNELHTRGYVSVGCQPCTRAVLPGQHERAGRWWWEESTSKECGLHTLTDTGTVSESATRPVKSSNVDSHGQR